MPADRLVDAGSARRDSWEAVLEPEGGASFDVFIQNPYSRPDDPARYLRRIRVSRGCGGADPRALRLAPRDDGDPASPLVFGDDEIYVANHQDRTPYDFARPYYYPAADAAFLTASRPPTMGTTFTGELAACMADGCFHALKRRDVFAVLPKNQLRRRSNPLSAPDFGVAMTYALARRTLDIWKVYLFWDDGFEGAVAKPFGWWFGSSLGRLEIVPFIKDDPSDVASSGYGFVQLGSGPDAHHTTDLYDTAPAALPGGGTTGSTPYWLNADVLSHEIGHHLVYTRMGFGPGVTPDVSGPDWFGLWAGGADPGEGGDAFRAFHEAAADIVSIVTALHDKRFLQAVLADTGGDIFTVNAATSLGEVNPQKTIRNTLNNVRLPDVPPRSAGDPPAKRYYGLSQVISGALFDVMAGLTARYLAVYATLPPAIIEEWELADEPAPIAAAAAGQRPLPADLLSEGDAAREDALHAAVKALYAGPEGPAIVEAAVTRARDGLGRLLGGYLAGKRPDTFDPAGFSLPALREDLVAVASRQPSTTLDGATKAAIVRRCFAWRGI